MPTVQQIIDFADRYYPNGETTANKILDLEIIHGDLYEKIIRRLNKFSQFTDYTIANQYTYTFYSDCTPDNVIKIAVSSDVTGSITDATTWQEYEYADINKEVSSGYYWGKLTNTTYILIKDGIAIDTANYEIRVTYYPLPTALTAVTQIPDLDETYHDILHYSLCQMLASEGDNPDTEVANYWQAKVFEQMQDIDESLKERLEASPIEDQILQSRW